MSQRPLFCDAIQLKTKFIAKRQDFEGLFEGFTTLRAVSYVVSPALLLEFMDQRRYEKVEVLVGEKMAASDYRQEIAEAGRDVLDRLAHRMETGDLVIHVPDRTVHSKLYLLEGAKGARVIVTSANLTETARRATRQTNYAWSVDCDRADPLFARMVEDYERHLKGSTRFLGDLRYALKLLCGRALEPLPGAQFTKGRVRNATMIGTAFPLVFDDVMLTQKAATFEEVLKAYWEVWWREDFVSPQIILSSNTATLKEWARSRVKRIDFDVHFSPDGRKKERLAALFAERNPLFRWFSTVYLDAWGRAGPPDEDELHTAREVFRGLYAHAGRPLPDCFPAEPLEKLYDPGRREWRDLVHRLGKAKIDWDTDRAVVRFSEDMQRFEVAQYASLLPPSVKHGQRGSTVVVESRDVFRRWLEGAGRPARSWWSRLLRRP